MLVGSDYLILFGSDGVVLRLDRCTGAEQVLASGITAYSSVLLADYAWFSPRGADQYGLFRVHVSGGAVERVVADVTGYPTLRAHDATLYYLSGKSVNSPGWAVFALEARQTEPTQLATLETQPGYVHLAGVSDAGLYFTLDYDCFCTPPLRRLPFFATELVPVPGAEGGGGRGAISVAIAGEHLYVRSKGQIDRLPLVGGQPEVVVPVGTSGEGLVHFEATDRSVCWMAYEGLEVSARCADLGDPSRTVRELDRFESGDGISFGLAPDAAYWMRPSTQSGFYELVAAAL